MLGELQDAGEMFAIVSRGRHSLAVGQVEAFLATYTELNTGKQDELAWLLGICLNYPGIS